jgi:flavin reductase (DIM6/NTAB) family NADH-FMN oxidoreductase RutF
MDIPWGSPAATRFVTNVGLLTSDGPHGPNVMAAEWTHHVSYQPGLIMITIHHEDATAQNIDKTKEFGVNLASQDQNWVASIAGGSHGQKVNKVAILKELGVQFYKAKKIKAPMIKGAALNVECKLLKTVELGDHVGYVGEALEVSADETKRPIVYHGGKYWQFGLQIQKPPQDFLDKIAKLVEKHRKV